MFCPKCGSDNVTVSIQQASTKTKKHGNGFGGHMNNMARGLTPPISTRTEKTSNPL